MQREFFPREVVTDVPRVTLTGSERLLVEQHKGLMACTAEMIDLHTACGVLRIEGSALVFLRYNGTEALIAGRIDAITLLPEGRRG